MHLACLGVVRKLIKFWIGGSLRTSGNVASRLPSRYILLLSEKLIKLGLFTPREFACQPRGLSEVDRWKAPEFRQFLLYTGPVVLSSVLLQTVYQHFMLISAAVTLLASPVLCQEYNDYANSLLVTFVESFSSLYASDFVIVCIVESILRMMLKSMGL